MEKKNIQFFLIAVLLVHVREEKIFK